MPKEKSEKAYRQRSVMGTLAKILGAVVVVLVLAGLGFRFGAPGAWDSSIDWIQRALDGPLLGIFQKLSGDYVSEAPDMEGDEKQAWKERLGKTATALREKKGTSARRKELRTEYESIVDKMKDGDLTKAELAPFEKKLDTLLEQIETEEVQKRE